MIESALPDPALRDCVRYYYQVGERLGPRSDVQPVPARSPQAIEFTFGTPYTVHRLDRGTAEPAHAIALVGAQTFRRVDLVMRGHVDAFTIVFQPGGLFGGFRVPADVLTNDHFEGESVLGRRLGELQRRLGDVSSFEDRVRVANVYLRRHRPAAEAVSPIAAAAGEMVARSGCVRVSDCARAVGLGLRQFERRFRHEVGITPKLYARIARFEAALRCKAAAPDTPWTMIAHDLAYHDQMHMVHDFNRLSGDSPTGIDSQLDMFVRPEVRRWLDLRQRLQPRSTPC